MSLSCCRSCAGFTGLNGPVPLLTGEGSSADFTASWDAANFRLVFIYNSIAVRAADQRTSLYTAPHVAIDVHGLAVDSPELTIGTYMHLCAIRVK